MSTHPRRLGHIPEDESDSDDELLLCAMDRFTLQVDDTPFPQCNTRSNTAVHSGPTVIQTPVPRPGSHDRHVKMARGRSSGRTSTSVGLPGPPRIPPGGKRSSALVLPAAKSNFRKTESFFTPLVDKSLLAGIATANARDPPGSGRTTNTHRGRGVLLSPLDADRVHRAGNTRINKTSTATTSITALTARRPTAAMVRALPTPTPSPTPSPSTPSTGSANSSYDDTAHVSSASDDSTTASNASLSEMEDEHPAAGASADTEDSDGTDEQVEKNNKRGSSGRSTNNGNATAHKEMAKVRLATLREQYSIVNRTFARCVKAFRDGHMTQSKLDNMVKVAHKAQDVIQACRKSERGSAVWSKKAGSDFVAPHNTLLKDLLQHGTDTAEQNGEAEEGAGSDGSAGRGRYLDWNDIKDETKDLWEAWNDFMLQVDTARSPEVVAKAGGHL